MFFIENTMEIVTQILGERGLGPDPQNCLLPDPGAPGSFLTQGLGPDPVGCFWGMMTFLELAHMRDATQPMVWGGWGMMTFLELAQRLSEPRVVPISHKGCPNQVPPLNPTPKPKGLSPSPTPKPQVPMSQPSKPKGLLGSALSQFCGSALIQMRGRL